MGHSPPRLLDVLRARSRGYQLLRRAPVGGTCRYRSKMWWFASSFVLCVSMGLSPVTHRAREKCRSDGDFLDFSSGLGLDDLRRTYGHRPPRRRAARRPRRTRPEPGDSARDRAGTEFALLAQVGADPLVEPAPDRRHQRQGVVPDDSGELGVKGEGIRHRGPRRFGARRSKHRRARMECPPKRALGGPGGMTVRQLTRPRAVDQTGTVGAVELLTPVWHSALSASAKRPRSNRKERSRSYPG